MPGFELAKLAIRKANVSGIPRVHEGMERGAEQKLFDLVCLIPGGEMFVSNASVTCHSNLIRRRLKFALP